MLKPILVGFEVPSGEPVTIRPGHLIITGITQHGKTTALEALITRSGLRAIAFKTKPGETGFSIGRIIPPFYVENTDWMYVESILEAAMEERMKFERAWIIRACKGNPSSLEDVDRNVVALLNKCREGSLQYNVYLCLHAYFRKILPQLKEAPFSKDLQIGDGVNIMDLERFSDPLQALVISSVLSHVLSNMKNVVTIIPEAWKFLPEGRKTPVVFSAEKLIRQGAVRGNYVWLDSQDIANVSKTILKQAQIWILGRQLERNEVEHTLDQMPLPKRMKPNPDEIMNLKIGQFYCCTSEGVKKTYVMPSWLDEEIAKKVAMGKIAVEQIMDRKTISLEQIDTSTDAILVSMREQLDSYARKLNELVKERDAALDEIKRLKSEIQALKSQQIISEDEYRRLKTIERKHLLILSTLQRIMDVLKSEVSQKEITLHPFQPAETILQPSQPQIPLEKNALLARLPVMARRIYEVLFQNPSGLTRLQIAMLTGYSSRSGTFNNTLSQMKQLKLITQDGDLFKVRMA